MALIEVNWNPDRRQLRSFGGVCLVAFGAIGTWIFLKHTIVGFNLAERTAVTTAYILWATAVLCGLLGTAAPPLLRPLYIVLSAISLPIGYVLSHIVMAGLFYAVLTPFGLLFRLIGRDPLCRRFDATARSYWTARATPTTAKRYFRQF